MDWGLETLALSLAVAARQGYREIAYDAGEQNSVAVDTVAHACPLSRRTAVDTIARAACAYGVICLKEQMAVRAIG